MDTSAIEVPVRHEPDGPSGSSSSGSASSGSASSGSVSSDSAGRGRLRPVRWLCGLVAVAAEIVGVAMLAAPDSTDRYFSWPLGPPPLASLIGALYVASAVVFGWAAAHEDWPGIRPLCIAVFGLTTPTLVATAHHRDAFDFGRWQAIAWVVLFAASFLLFALVLATMRDTRRRASIEAPAWRVPRGGQALLLCVSAAYATSAAVLWSSPGWVAQHGPLAAGALALRFVGSWSAFLAILAVHAAVRPRWSEARVPIVSLVAFPLAALAAGLATLDELRAGPPRAAYLVGLAVLAATPAPLLVRPAPPAR